jgi:ubiquinone biosynthesis protein Coq4
LWDPFWALVNASGSGGGGALDVTARTADLGRHLSEAFSARLGTASYAYPNVRETAAKGLPPQFDLDTLGTCPEGSLGHAFYRQIVDNGFDLEVLDRDVLALSSLAAPHDFINTRMLQSHDLIHLLAGYELTALHEVGISAFQLAQCGHGYSAMFLAVVATGAAASDNPGALPFVLETVLGAWTHGRRSASLIPLDWQAVWDQPIATIRQNLGMAAFNSPFPADIIEQLAKVA